MRIEVSYMHDASLVSETPGLVIIDEAQYLTEQDVEELSESLRNLHSDNRVVTMGTPPSEPWAVNEARNTLRDLRGLNDCIAWATPTPEMLDQLRHPYGLEVLRWFYINGSFENERNYAYVRGWGC